MHPPQFGDQVDGLDYARAPVKIRGFRGTVQIADIRLEGGGSTQAAARRRPSQVVPLDPEFPPTLRDQPVVPREQVQRGQLVERPLWVRRPGSQYCRRWAVRALGPAGPPSTQ
ncbi:hypothetical protein [Rhodococcus sp. NPDC049939]|uniref:hypothetical protein n=1 Tax=Rhodococcus sp. NPDC049939 TaxID=3155511 RepID=UPI0033CE89C7